MMKQTVRYANRYFTAHGNGHFPHITRIAPDDGETFFGYYDKCPENEAGNAIIFHRSTYSTRKSPSAKQPVEIWAKVEGVYVKIDESLAYNWQQGTRLHWISNESFIYNVAGVESYESRIYSLKEDAIIRTLSHAISDTYKNVGLTLNYNTLYNHIPDYGYKNKGYKTGEMLDGIGMIDLASGEYRTLLETELLPGYIPGFYLNHIMINPDGSSFLFLMRRKAAGAQYDNLFVSDFSGNYSLLGSSPMISHYIWKDPITAIVYGQFGGKQGYFLINVASGKHERIERMSSYGDGHPSVRGDSVYFDTYPNRLGYKKLIKYPGNEEEVSELATLWEPATLHPETRCDLHPRINSMGDKLFFDSNHTGRRSLYMLEIN